MSATTPKTELERRVDADVQSVGEHAAHVLVFAVTEELDGMEMQVEGHGAIVILRQMVRDWLAAQDALALRRHTESDAEADDDDDDSSAAPGTPA